MFRRRALRPILLAGALPLLAAAGVAEQLPLKTYTTADGLPSDRIHCVLADSHGFLWVGTSGGLSRFDGYGFRGFTAEDGVPPGAVQAIVESPAGAYWLGTSAGLVRLDVSPGDGRPGVAASVLHAAEGGLADQIGALFAAGGVLWAGTEDGLFRLDLSRSDAALERAAWSPKLPYGTAVSALASDSDGSLLVGCEAGLFRRRRDGTIERITDGNDLPGPVRALRRDRHGALWVGTHYQGLFELGEGGGSSARVLRHVTMSDGLAGNHVTSLFETSEGVLWVSCFGGVTRISADRTGLRSYGRGEGLSALGLWSLAEDRNGNLWIGSDDAGLQRLPRVGFERFDERDGLTSLRIASLFQSRDGEVCNFANAQRADQYDDGFLQCFDGRRFRTRRLRLPAGTKLGWGWAQVSFQDSRGEWWVPTLSGLYRFPPVPFDALDRTDPVRVYTKRDGLPDDQIYRVFEDRRGDLWIGLIDGRDRLARWERASGAITTFGPGQGVADREPMAFAEDPFGAVWVGFREGGLARWRDGRIAWFDHKDGLPAGSIRALYLDARGRLWIGSGRDGLARIDRPGDSSPSPRFERLGLAEGLSSASISTITEDEFGRIYAGTERWLDRIDPATGNVQHFTADDGLAHGVIQSSLRDRAGTLWFGSFEGLSRLRPEKEARRSPAPVRILRALVNGVRQPLSDIGATTVALEGRLAEPASVQIDFVALDFAPGGRPRYEYRMDGIDRAWSAPAEQRSVVYARVPAGGYRFRVRAVSNDGAIGTEEADVRFRVLPPFWKRPEVIAALALAAVAVAFALHRMRLKSALAVERVRSRVARDLHDDVGAGLSEIAILSEVAANGNGRSSHSDGALREIGDEARRLVDSMSDIVWSTDPRQDDAASLVARIRHFAANTLDGRRIAWSLDVPPQFEARSLDAETRRQLLLIVKEALTNVARHSGCTRASVRIAPAARHVAIEIEDDGRGFAAPNGNGAGGHGLSNMRSRAEALGGTLHVESEPAAGTRVLLEVPLGGARRRPSA